MSDQTRVFQKDYFLFEVDSGRSVRLFDGLQIGRSDCHYNIPNDPSVSRAHVSIRVENDKVQIMDLGSTNKTRLNGRVVKPNALYTLFVGDQVELGNRKFVLRTDMAGASAPVPVSKPVAPAVPVAPRQAMIELVPVAQGTPPPMEIALPGLAFSATELSKLGRPSGIANPGSKKPSAPPPPTQAMITAYSKNQRKIILDHLKSFIRLRGWRWIEWCQAAVAFAFLCWYVESPLRSALSVSGLPHSAFGLGARIFIPSVVAFFACFFPTFVVTKKSGNSPFARALGLAATGAFCLIVALSSWLFGFSGAAEVNQLFVSCSNESDAARCRDALFPDSARLAAAPQVTVQVLPVVAKATPPIHTHVTKPNYEDLSLEKQDYIRVQYEVAKDFYKAKQFEEAANGIRKILELVENYRDSRQILHTARLALHQNEAIGEASGRAPASTSVEVTASPPSQEGPELIGPVKPTDPSPADSNPAD